MNTTMTPQTKFFFALVGTTEDGATVWYTGRAGAGFISADKAEAYTGYSVEGANLAARRLNRGTALHGVLFTPYVGVVREVR